MRGHGQGHNPVSLEDVASRGCCSRVAELGPPGPQSRGGNSVLRPRAGAQSSHPTGLPGTGSLSPRISLSQQSCVEAAGLGRPSDLRASPCHRLSWFYRQAGVPSKWHAADGSGSKPTLSHHNRVSCGGGGEAGECAPHSGGRRERAQSLSLSGQD